MEIANLNVYVQKGAIGKTLRVAFGGVIERAEVLASMLRAWGTAAEARPGDEEWEVVLYSGQLSAVDRPEFKRALEALVAKAREKGILADEQAERKATGMRLRG